MDKETIIDQLLDRWEEALESGKVLSIEELCHEHPELSSELKQQISALQKIGGILDPESTESSGSHSKSAPNNDPCRLTGKVIEDRSNLQVDGFFRKGGVGAIYYATQANLGRNVALKAMIPSSSPLSSIDSQAAIDRFQTEAEITSRLEHPGIIPIYQQGQSDNGTPFYTMRFVQDSCLDDFITDFHSKKLLPNETEEQFLFLLQNFSAACKTIAYVHSRGIVHRDIKPQNILIGKYGETLVIDWGLARSFKRTGQFKTVSEETLDIGESQSSEVSSDKDGTIAYMSPQQHQGRIPAPSDDIYSLGATLYKILCGKSPVSHLADCRVAEVRQKVIQGEIPTPVEQSSDASPEIQSICQKAMSLRSGDRYNTALELAADIDHFIAGQPVSTFKDSFFKTSMRWMNRNLLTTKLLGLGLVLATASLLFLMFLFLHQSSSHNTARKQNLQSLASSYAKRVGQELDLRIRVLEHESQSDSLIQLVSSWNESRKDFQKAVQQENKLTKEEKIQFFEPLAKWAAATTEKYDGRSQQEIAFKALCVYDPNGTIIARYGTRHDLPDGTTLQEYNSVISGAGTKILGKSFHFRDYFHARGFDLPAPSSKNGSTVDGQNQGKIHRHPFYVSSVYKNRSNGDFHFQITVPIYDKSNTQDPIGLLGMAMRVGQMNFPKNGIVVSDGKSHDGPKPAISQIGLIIHNRHESKNTANLSEQSLSILTGLLQKSSDRFKAQLVPSSFDDRALDVPENSLLSVSRITIPTRKNREENVFLTNWLLIAVEDLNNE